MYVLYINQRKESEKEIFQNRRTLDEYYQYIM